MKKLHIIPRSDGYVALMAVLIVGATSLALGVSLLLAGTDSQRSVAVTQQSAQARNAATACAEEGLQKIRDTNSFTGTATLTLGANSCSYTVTSTGATTRVIDAQSSINGVARKVKVYVTITSLSISVTSWQDVSDV